MGMGKVITGIDVGMKGMCKWERRDITVPPQLGYGQRQVGTYKSIFNVFPQCNAEVN